MFSGFNWADLFFLIVLAVILFGPEKLPEFAKKAGRIVNYLRDVGSDARGQLREELGPEFDDYHLSDLNPRNFVNNHILNQVDQEDLAYVRGEFSDVTRMASMPVRSSITASPTPSAPYQPAASVPAELVPSGAVEMGPTRWDNEAT